MSARTKLAALQTRITDLERSLKEAERRRGDGFDLVGKRDDLLDNLLKLDPTLDRFRIAQDSWLGRDREWDYDGIAVATAHNAGKDAAERFAPKGGRA